MAYATIFEVPKFITNLRNLQENITRRLDSIIDCSNLWINILKLMLTVDEERRPDFIAFSHEIDRPRPYADDEPIPVVGIDSSQNNIDPLQLIVTCGLQHVRVSDTLEEEVPCMISLKAVQTDPNLSCYSTDIIAVIDESGSMAGTRMSLVQATLSKLVQMLGNRDRVSIVTFSDDAEKKCPLICCSSGGKGRLQQFITKLRGRGNTNISAGFITALDVLEQRRTKNTAASLLLFSDGQNNRGPPPLPACLEKYNSGFYSQVTVHSFGYGDDIDSKLMEALSSEGKGVFYHITTQESIQDAFALAYANITTVVARNLRVCVKVNPGAVSCTVPQIYSKDGSDSFSLLDITVNQQKDMIFILKAGHQTLTKATRFVAITVTINYSDNSGCDTEDSANLSIKFIPWVEIVPAHDISVYANWYRVKGAYCLKEARSLAERQLFREADQRLRNGFELIASSGYEKNDIVAAVMRDLEAAQKLVQDDKTWKRGGDAHFASISYSHLSQTASTLAMQYSSDSQRRSVNMMNQLRSRLDTNTEEEATTSPKS